MEKLTFLKKNNKKNSQINKNYKFKISYQKHFSEEISDIETLKDSKYTVFCLQTKIYLFSLNGRELFDIIPCCNPQVYSAICKTLTHHAVVASLFSSGANSSIADYKEDSVQIKDYSSATKREEDLKITKPFGNGYEIGGLSLDEEGHRLAVVSKDACYLYLYITYNRNQESKTEDTKHAIEIKDPI